MYNTGSCFREHARRGVSSHFAGLGSLTLSLTLAIKSRSGFTVRGVSMLSAARTTRHRYEYTLRTR